MTSDEHYMEMALRLARKGLGRTSPNPMVGAVLVRDGQVIGHGYHKKYGQKHAEVNAIDNAGGDVKGSTLYTNLEPCCHHNKKTPPCTDAIIKKAIKRVVIGTTDPNSAVNGKGARLLQSKGIDVTTGVLENECSQLNEVYFKYIKTGIPFVTVKYAQTIGGRIATRDGQSQWISSGSSLRYAHRLRTAHDTIMVGIGTVLSDDPRLTVRLAKGKSPIPIIVDSKLRIPLEAQVLASHDHVIIATTSKSDLDKANALRELRADVLSIKEDTEGQISMKDLLRILAKRKIASVLVEGGSGIITSLFRERLADRLVVCIAPKILGSGLEAIGDLGISNLNDAIELSNVSVNKVGVDFILDGRIVK